VIPVVLVALVAELTRAFWVRTANPASPADARATWAIR
jgi:hypothetical protein